MNAFWPLKWAGFRESTVRQTCVIALLTFACGSDAFAGPIITVPNVPAGTQYRLVFVTSGTRDATSSNINVYNSFVQAQANLSPDLAALNTIWTAIGSTLTINARDNTSTNPNTAVGVAIYQLAGDLVANNNADLWDGAISTSISTNQFGDFDSDFVWTGTHHNGIVSAYPVAGIESVFPLGGSPGIFSLNFAQVGLSGSSNSVQWVNTTRANINDSLFSLYAISDVLTAGGAPATAVPEPSSLLIAGVGAFVLLLSRHLRKKEPPLIS